jgi:hypothetical protein
MAGNPTLGTYYEYVYDGDNLIREELYSGRDAYGSLISSMNYEFDNKGNKVREYRYDPRLIGQYGAAYSDGIINEKNYLYDNQNRLITVMTHDWDYDTPLLYVSEKYEYDNDNRVSKLEYYDYTGFSGYVKKTYRGTSTMLDKEFCFDKNGNQTSKYQHYYDEWGNLTETVINDECSIFKRKYKGKLLMEEIHYWAHEYGFWGRGQMPENGMSKYEYKEL